MQESNNFLQKNMDTYGKAKKLVQSHGKETKREKKSETETGQEKKNNDGLWPPIRPRDKIHQR